MILVMIFKSFGLTNNDIFLCFFKDESVTLEEASKEKLDRICRKLNFSEQDSVLGIGTGWGSFSIHAAKNYGCNVTTTTYLMLSMNMQAGKKEEGLGNKNKSH
ncbi:hypothetical protein Ct9H90mP29_08320 [bacterium]|nr:MAG: hypothetical protein Ct9H90mP29_08320 [bacterium]